MNKLGTLGPKMAFQAFSKVGSQQTSVRTAFVISSDWLPGKRPRTEEEMKEAAKKYNLLPEEYEPQPDDGFACGDYPHLPGIHYDQRDPFYPYDYPVYRRNYGEPVADAFLHQLSNHHDIDNVINRKVHPLKQFLIMSLVVGGVGTILYLGGIKYRYYEPRFQPPLYEAGVTRYGYNK